MNTTRSDYKINSARKYKIRQRNYSKERKSKDIYFVCAKASTIREQNSDQRQTTGSTTDTETKTLQLPRHPVRKFFSFFFCSLDVTRETIFLYTSFYIYVRREEKKESAKKKKEEEKRISSWHLTTSGANCNDNPIKRRIRDQRPRSYQANTFIGF